MLYRLAEISAISYLSICAGEIGAARSIVVIIIILSAQAKNCVVRLPRKSKNRTLISDAPSSAIHISLPNRIIPLRPSAIIAILSQRLIHLIRAKINQLRKLTRTRHKRARNHLTLPMPQLGKSKLTAKTHE